MRISHGKQGRYKNAHFHIENTIYNVYYFCALKQNHTYGISIESGGSSEDSKRNKRGQGRSV